MCDESNEIGFTTEERKEKLTMIKAIKELTEAGLDMPSVQPDDAKKMVDSAVEQIQQLLIPNNMKNLSASQVRQIGIEKELARIQATIMYNCEKFEIVETIRDSILDDIVSLLVEKGYLVKMLKADVNDRMIKISW